MRARYEQAKVAAPALGLTVRSLEVRDTRELNEAFEAISGEHPEAVVLNDPFKEAWEKSSERSIGNHITLSPTAATGHPSNAFIAAQLIELPPPRARAATAESSGPASWRS